MDPVRESVPPRPPRRGFTGFSTSIIVGSLAATGVILAAVVALGLDRLGNSEVTRLWDELEAQKSAGELAHQALARAEVRAKEEGEALRLATQLAAESRAARLALEAADGSPSLQAEESVGTLEQGRITGLQASGLATGATLAVARPDLAPLGRPGFQSVSAADGAWAAAPDGQRKVIARVAWPMAPDPIPLAEARRLVGSLAAPAAPPAAVQSSFSVFAAMALLTALFVALIVHFRLVRPLGAALDAARDFDHGVREARANADRGAKDAREVARIVNALIERAERHQAEGRAARNEDVQGAALAIVSLGQGDLRDPMPTLGEPFEPIGSALEGARHDLIDRVTALHHAAGTIAGHAAELGPSAKKVADSATHQREALRHLGDGLSQAEAEVGVADEKLHATAGALLRHGSEQRAILQEVRASLFSVARRITDLAAAQDQLTRIFAASASLDQAMALLARLAARRGDDGVDLPPARMTAMVGEGRAAFETVQKGLVALRQDLAEIGSVLEHTAAAQPEPVGDLKAEITAPLFELAATMVRVCELSSASLKALERAERSSAEGALELLERSHRAQAELKELAPAFAGIRVGAAFEDALIDRLERARNEVIAAASASDQLTADGRRLLAEVRAASEAARARLGALVEATESALAVLRG